MGKFDIFAEQLTLTDWMCHMQQPIDMWHKERAKLFPTRIHRGKKAPI